MSCVSRRTWMGSSIAMLAAAVWFPCVACGQQPKSPTTMPDDDNMVGMAEHAMTNMKMDSVMQLHMQMTPMRAATREDTVRALNVVTELRHAIAKYKDVSVAERDGF